MEWAALMVTPHPHQPSQPSPAQPSPARSCSLQSGLGSSSPLSPSTARTHPELRHHRHRKWASHDDHKYIRHQIESGHTAAPSIQQLARQPRREGGNQDQDTVSSSVQLAAHSAKCNKAQPCPAKIMTRAAAAVAPCHQIPVATNNGGAQCCVTRPHYHRQPSIHRYMQPLLLLPSYCHPIPMLFVVSS